MAGKPISSAAPPDDARAKLLEAAGEVIGEVGYQAATVREICKQAGVNVAAVNYYFGDKFGLYCELLTSLLRKSEMRLFALPGGPPEERLRFFLHGFLRSLLGQGRPSWASKVIAREFTQPTEALQRVVDEVTRPNEAALRAIAAELLGCSPDDEQARLSAHSIIGQCLHYFQAAPVLTLLWPDLWTDPERISRVADHIANFSLAALRGLAHSSHSGAN